MIDGITQIGQKFEQRTLSNKWIIHHNLNSYPEVFVKDYGGNVIEGEVIYDNENLLTIGFSCEVCGYAFLL